MKKTIKSMINYSVKSVARKKAISNCAGFMYEPKKPQSLKCNKIIQNN